MSFGYIYRTTCFPSGRVYIGKKSRGAFDPEYLGSGIVLRVAVRKHGRPAFLVEVLEFAEDRASLNKAERRAIIEHRALLGRKNVYNISSGGDGFGTGTDNPSFGANKGVENKHFGRKHSPEAKRAIGDRVRANSGARKAKAAGTFWLKGRKQTADHIEKGRLTRVGRPNPCSKEKAERISAAHRKRIDEGRPWQGIPHRDETKELISAIRRKFYADGGVHPMSGRNHSEETKRKISDTKRRKFAELQGVIK